jgi:FG-GAP repeat
VKLFSLKPAVPCGPLRAIFSQPAILAMVFLGHLAAGFPVLAQGPNIGRSEIRLEPAGDLSETDLFGYSAAVSGNTMVIGAFGADGAAFDTGAAYVFERSGNRWVQTAKLFALDGRSFDLFGGSIAISGDTVVVGAQFHDQPGAPKHSGTVYVFQRINGTWVQQAELTSPTASTDELLGIELGVGISGDTIVIMDQGGRINDPSVMVFTRTGGSWRQTATLVVPDDFSFAPSSVAIDGNTVVVGSNFSDGGNASEAGAAYVFALTDGQWSLQATLSAADATSFAGFGFSVAVSGDVAAVGAMTGPGASAQSGAGYVFARKGGVWTQTAKLIAGDGADFDAFGACIGVSGQTVLVGAPSHTTAAGPSAGAAYVYQRKDGGWFQVAELAASDGVTGGSFGFSIAIQNNTMLVGADSQEPAVEGNGYPGGEAYVYRVN